MTKKKSKKQDLEKRIKRLEQVLAEHEKRERQVASHRHGHTREQQSGSDEKRVIDTITRNVVERVAKVIQRENQLRDRRNSSDHRHRDDHREEEPRRDEGRRDEGRRDGGRRDERGVHHDRGRRGGDRRQHHSGHDDQGNEKRIVDLVVGLVSEHVREVIAEELDMRMGTPNTIEVIPENSSEDEDDATLSRGSAKTTKAKTKPTTSTRRKKNSGRSN